MLETGEVELDIDAFLPLPHQLARGNGGIVPGNILAQQLLNRPGQPLHRPAAKLPESETLGIAGFLSGGTACQAPPNVTGSSAIAGRSFLVSVS